MAASAESIDEKEDSRVVIEKFKSGFSPPGDIPFEDLSTIDSTSVNGSMTSMQQSINPILEKKSSIIGTITGGRIRKRSGLLGLFTSSKASSLNGDSKKEDFSELPPNQRRKKLQSKIDEITGKICQETAARDGLMKMKQVYESNPALGDPMSIQGQLTENGHRLDKLRSELKKFQDFLDELEGKAPSSPALRPKADGEAKVGGSLKKKKKSTRRSSVSDGGESLSRSGSDSSMSQQRRGSKNSEATNMHGASRSPESGICTSSMSLPSSSSGSNDNSGKSSRDPAEDVGHADVDDDDDEDEEFYDADPFPIVGRCRALYPFEVTSEGSIRMEENEDLWLIESDQGDGWTRVRRIKPSPMDPMPEGFVPTSYIETTELFAVPHPV
jgi:hypothetical protein